MKVSGFIVPGDESVSLGSHDREGSTGVTAVCVCRRERSKVPYIVRQCIEEVEKRGIDEVGIYRISGVATDIQALKTAFDNSKTSSMSFGVRADERRQMCVGVLHKSLSLRRPQLLLLR